MSVELGWIDRDLRAVERLSGDAVVGSLFADERPPRGVAALLDWRLSGRLSALCISGYLTGEADELMLLPGRPRLPFDKLLMVGLGPRALFDEEAYRRALGRVFGALVGLQVRRVAIDLPGRHAAVVPPARALELLGPLLDPLAGTGTRASLEVVTLIDDREAVRAYDEARPERRNRAARR